MLNITIDKYVNGYGVRVYDSKDGYALNETHDKRLDALKAVEQWLRDEIIKDLEARRQ